MDGGSEGLPDAPVAGVSVRHALGLELQADEEPGLGVVEGLDQAILSVRLRTEAGCEQAHALVMMAAEAHLHTGEGCALRAVTMKCRTARPRTSPQVERRRAAIIALP